MEKVTYSLPSGMIIGAIALVVVIVAVGYMAYREYKYKQLHKDDK